MTNFARETHIRKEVTDRVLKAKIAQVKLIATYFLTIDEDHFSDFN